MPPEHHHAMDRSEAEHPQDQPSTNGEQPTKAPLPPISQLESKEHGSFGPIVSIIIIIALLGFGGIYFWGASLTEQELPTDDIPLILGDESGGDELYAPMNDTDLVGDMVTGGDATGLEEFDLQIEQDLQMVEVEAE